MKTIPIGTGLTLSNGITVVVAAAVEDSCSKCAFGGRSCSAGSHRKQVGTCFSTDRKDHNAVYFKLSKESQL